MDDLISRQAAIDALADMHCKSDEDGYVWIIRSDAWARIDALPSVTPKQKTGMAVFKSDGEKGFWVCNQCGERVHTWEKYCSECGAKMI